jgi:prepilin-type processing-associated H-X9-DG protein
MLWVLTDEDPSGLNDAAFAFGMTSPSWFDFPGSFHNNGCGFAFADAHSETHKWLRKPSTEALQGSITDPAGLQDWNWLRDRTSANINGTP